jgi:hypothetical protein
MHLFLQLTRLQHLFSKSRARLFIAFILSRSYYRILDPSDIDVFFLIDIFPFFPSYPRFVYHRDLMYVCLESE